ncbi:MAG: hypothetical protein PVG32_18995 [Anaerolineales bacterium]|jgi:hypothetical protein
MIKKISNRDWENISAHLDGQLPPSKQAHFAERLESEPALRDAYDSLRSTRAVLRSLPRLRAPRNFTLTPEMAGIRQRKKRLRLIPSFQFASALASLLLLLVLAGDFLGLGNITPGSQRFTTSPDEVVMQQEAPAVEEEIAEIQVTKEVEVEEEAAQEPLLDSAQEQPVEAMEQPEEELAAPMFELSREITPTLMEEEPVVKPIPEPGEGITRTEPSEGEAGAVLGSEEAPSMVLKEPSYPLPSLTPQIEVPPEPITYLPYIRIAEISLAVIAVFTGFMAYFLRRRG